MKNSAFYARKIKRLLGGARKLAPPEATDPLRLMLLAILEENAVPRQAAAALAALEQEFVDFNELRVSPIKDIVDVMGRDFPQARVKAETMTVALNAAFDRVNLLSLESLVKKPKREVRRLLREDIGLSPYAESVVTLRGFGGHAVPVDEQLLVGLKLEEYIHPQSDLDDLRGFLERLVPGKDALAVHELLRDFVAKNHRKVAAEVGRLERLRRAQEQARTSAVRSAPPAAPPAPLPEEAELEEPEEPEDSDSVEDVKDQTSRLGSLAREVARLKASRAAGGESSPAETSAKTGKPAGPPPRRIPKGPVGGSTGVSPVTPATQARRLCYNPPGVKPPARRLQK